LACLGRLFREPPEVLGTGFALRKAERRPKQQGRAKSATQQRAQDRRWPFRKND